MKKLKKVNSKIIYFRPKNHLLDDFQEQGESIYEYAYTQPKDLKVNERRGLKKIGLGSY